MAIGRVNTGGGGSGGTLTVTGVVGHTVTATKGGKTYTRTFNSSGVAVFKGLSTGTWTLTMTGDGQTATRTVTVNADYAVTITYFSATISITYPANSTCVVTNNGGQTVASDTNTGSSTKTWTATVNATGTYTVTATATDGSGKSKSQSVEITNEGQSVSVTLSYELIINFNKSVSASENVGITPNTDYQVLDTYTDLSSYTTLTFTVTSRTWSNVGNGYIRFGVNPDAAEAPTIYTQANASGATTVTLDISSVNGGYIGISCSAIAAGVSGTSKTGATVSTIIAT